MYHGILFGKKKGNNKFVPVNEKGEIKIEEIKKLISSKTKIIAITHISNVTGAITPLKEVIDIARSKKIPVLVDGTQGAPHINWTCKILIVIFMQFLVIKCTGQMDLEYFMPKKNG